MQEALITDTNQPMLRMHAESNSDSIMYIPVEKNADAFWCMLLVVVVWNRVQWQQWLSQCSQILDLVAVCVCVCVCVCVYMCMCVHVYVCVIEKCFS